MDLSTTYLGLQPAAPAHARRLAAGRPPRLVKRLEDAGAAAIVMHSLFEEQITREQLGMVYHMELLDHGSSPRRCPTSRRPDEFRLGPDQYLEQIRHDQADGEASRSSRRSTARPPRAGWTTRS